MIGFFVAIVHVAHIASLAFFVAIVYVANITFTTVCSTGYCQIQGRRKFHHVCRLSIGSKHPLKLVFKIGRIKWPILSSPPHFTPACHVITDI